MKRIVVTACLSAAALPLWPVATHAQQPAKPTPAECSGVAFVDAPGDSRFRPDSFVEVPGNQPSTDLRSGFFRYDRDPVTGVQVLTANLVVEDLDRTLPVGAWSAAWYMRWVTPGKRPFVRAVLYRTQQEPTAPVLGFDYGRFDPRVIVAEGETTGRFIEGPQGVIQIVVPVEEMGLTGPAIDQPSGMTAYSIHLSYWADVAPDNGLGRDFTLAPCEDTPPIPAPAVVEPPAVMHPSAAPAVAPGADSRRLRLEVGRLSARALRRAGTFPVRVIGGHLTAVSVSVRRGASVIARGRRSRIDDGGTVRLRVLRPPRLRPGVYRLRVDARRHDGHPVSAVRRIRIVR